MKAEAWIFGVNAAFFACVAPAYWFITGDPTGTSALVMSTGLAALITFYLGFHAKKMDPRRRSVQSDDHAHGRRLAGAVRAEEAGHDAGPHCEGEIVDGAGELGFFPPYSWWPLWCALSLVVCVLGVVFGWWILIIGIGVGSVTLNGWVFEYYRGEHAH